MENEETIYQMQTIELWRAFKRVIAETGKQYEAEEHQVKHGINIQVPIWYITEDWYTIYPENKRVHIRGHGKISVNDYMEEIDKREDIMRKIILENSEILESEEPRE